MHTSEAQKAIELLKEVQQILQDENGLVVVGHIHDWEIDHSDILMKLRIFLLEVGET